MLNANIMGQNILVVCEVDLGGVQVVGKFYFPWTKLLGYCRGADLYAGGTSV